MTSITLILELAFNNRVTAGLSAVEDHFAYDYGWAVVPGLFPGKDRIQVTLQDLDLGKFDSRGDAYICELLNILPGDLIAWTIQGEEVA